MGTLESDSLQRVPDMLFGYLIGALVVTKRNSDILVYNSCSDEVTTGIKYSDLLTLTKVR